MSETRTKGTPKLGCFRYTIERSVGDLTTLNASFHLLVSPYDSKETARMLSMIETMLASGVNLVADAGRPRCFYCASLNDDVTHCQSCGAPL